MDKNLIEARLRVIGRRAWQMATIGRLHPEQLTRVLSILQALSVEAFQLQVQQGTPVPIFKHGTSESADLPYIEEKGPEVIVIGGREYGKSKLVGALAAIHRTQVITDLHRSKMMAAAGRRSMAFSPQSMQKLYEAMNVSPQWGKELKHLAQDGQGLTELSDSVEVIAAAFNVPSQLMGGCHAGFSEFLPKQFECGVDLGNTTKAVMVRQTPSGGWEVKEQGAEQWVPATWEPGNKTLKFSAPITITNKPDTNGASETRRPQAND